MSTEKQPSVDIIIPVGPGHSELFQRAVDSVVVAAEYAEVEARIIRVSDEKGGLGRSFARNHGVMEAESDWLFFLDADDLMHPRAFNAWDDYCDNRDAIFGTINELVGGNVVERYQVPTIYTYAQLIKNNPFFTIQMGHFIKREVALQLPFNTEMDTGEDWDYYIRLWRQFNCIKIDYPLMINCRGQHSTGPRSATGKDWCDVVGNLLDEARNNVEETREQFTERMGVGFGNGETPCGPGSTIKYTENIRDELPKIIKEHGVKLMCDAGCGDRHWISGIDLGCDYKGFDLHYPEKLDVSVEQLPKCDLILCRDVMIHMPVPMIQDTLALFKKSAPLLLATSYDDFSNEPSNVPNRVLNLGYPPFSLELAGRIDEPSPGKFTGLWKL